MQPKEIIVNNNLCWMPHSKIFLEYIMGVPSAKLQYERSCEKQ
jgi:hypothetical protein